MTETTTALEAATASLKKGARSDGDHRVRVSPGGPPGTHCVDCRQDLRPKADPRQCTYRACREQTPPLWHHDGERCGCVLARGHADLALPEGDPGRDHVCSCGARWDSVDYREEAHDGEH